MAEISAAPRLSATGPADQLAFDQAHIWHPYSSMTSPRMPYLVDSAAGVRLRLRPSPEANPIEVIDAMSSWWCAIHGYAVPELDAAAHAQLSAMSHVMFGGLTHEPAIALARSLVGLTPPELDRVFFADSGSVAVEVALKMAWQATSSTPATGTGTTRAPARTKILALRGGYHGDTFGAMSVCDPVGGMHSMYASTLPQHIFAPRPPARGADLTRWKAEVDNLFDAHGGQVAAMICEPLLQGAGGMHLYDPEAVQHLAIRAREVGALVIFDEIATGFWRTGTRWALDACRVVPDILCVGKALTGGYLSLAAVITSAEVAARVDASPAQAMMHGPTFMANPLACAIAAASIELLEGGEPSSNLARIEGRLTAGLALAERIDSVVNVRCLGGVGAVQLEKTVDVGAVASEALRRGVWVRPFRDVVYTMPPYISTDSELDTIASALVGAIETVHR